MLLRTDIFGPMFGSKISTDLSIEPLSVSSSVSTDRRFSFFSIVDTEDVEDSLSDSVEEL